MSASRHQPPHRLPPEGELDPIFGIFCQTETMSLKNQGTGSLHVHFEAYMDDPVKKTWAVAKVVNVHEASFYHAKDKRRSSIHRIKDKITFREAMEILSAGEAALKKQTNLYTTTVPDAPMMGFTHFKAFAEREGYVFDEQGKPHARPNPYALPMGCVFLEEDVDSANKNLQRPQNEFDNTGPASKVPHTHFLLDQFSRAAHKSDFDSVSSHLRMMNLLDTFVDHVDAAHRSMQQYCGHYQELGQGGHMEDAANALQRAELTLRQLKAYGVNTADFESFLLQCEISCAVLHAEGLYDLMNRGLGDFAQNELQFKAKVDQALDSFKKIDDSERGMNTLKNMIVQTPKPQVPDAIGHFIQTYRAQRKGFTPLPAAAKPEAPPRPPGP
jgi:hypothetical protein